MNTALLLIDIQKDYFPGGRNELSDTQPCVVQAAQALSIFRKRGLPVIYMQHVSLQAGASFFLPDTEGIQIHERISPLETEKIIVKHFPDSFLGTALLQHLQALHIKRLVVCGMMSHMCVDTTVRAAQRFSYQVIVLGDACTTKDLLWKGTRIPAKTVHQTFMASLQGTFADVIDTDCLDKAL